MKGIFLFLTTIATILFFAACSNEEVLDENTPEAERTLSLVASIPGDEPTSRVDLTQDEKNILLTWVVGDNIELLFKQGATEITQTVTATSISNGGKRAQFDIVIPQEITDGAFDLYGVYGGGGLSTSDPTKAVLPAKPSDATSLNTQNDVNSVQSRKDVMLYFASKNIQTANPQVSVNFKHLGSLFSVTVKNTSDTELTDIYAAKLEEVGGVTNWAYKFDQGNTFDLVYNEFAHTNTVYTYNYIYFTTEFSNVESGNSVTFWAWYPPFPDVSWPELNLELSTANEEFPDPVSVNTQPARTQPIMAGKAYHFYAEWDGSFLRFTGSMTDPRDGNVYKTVNIGTQVWMAENLKYLPSVVGPLTGSETNPYYYVYGYDGTSVSAAKATPNYNTYGVLYNWTAAMAGSASSEADPSGVQGICPAGWHLPSDAEWETLVPWQPEEDESVAGGILKETGDVHWNDPNTGATNQTGFTALPGGLRSGSPNPNFSNIKNYGYFWSTADNSSIFGGVRGLSYDNSKVIWYGISKEFGHSVRCVKD